MEEFSVYKSSHGRDAILETYDKILKRWPLPYEEFSISTSLGQTHIIACEGEGKKPLLLLLGSSSNALMWKGDVVDYSQDYRVYALDIPGEPGKSAEVRPDLNGDGYSNWLAEILDQLKINKTAMIGISLGGFLALKYATTRPDRVSKLVLLCPAGVAKQRISFLAKALILAPFGNAGRKQLIKLVYGNQTIEEETLAYTMLIAENFNPRMEIIPILNDESISRISCPVLLIVGENDVLINAGKTAGRMRELLSTSDVLILPDAGHVLIGLQKRIQEFLLN